MMFVLGLIPFLLGELLNWIMLTNDSVDLSSLIFTVGMLILLIWFLSSYLLIDWSSSKHLLIFLNLPAALVLALVAIQELIFKSYWLGFIGAFTQHFYLPLLNFGFILTSWAHHVLPAYSVSFLLLLAMSYLGGYLKSNKHNPITSKKVQK